MSKVIAGYSMSLDGFIADANDGVWSLYGWLMGGDTPVVTADRTFMTSAVSAAHYQNMLDTIGAHVTGKRDFDISEAWQGKHPMNVPAFIVTHNPPAEWTHAGSPFQFVTEGVERAIALAKQAAGAKNVVIGGSTILQQALNAGLIDEIHIDLSPVLLGQGIRLFDALANVPVKLEIISVMPAPGVTHLKYRVAQ
jgi:dihydrofolate reductase